MWNVERVSELRTLLISGHVVNDHALIAPATQLPIWKPLQYPADYTSIGNRYEMDNW
jgi:hypothetical protein